MHKLMENKNFMFVEVKNNFIGLVIYNSNEFIIFKDFFDTFSLEITKSYIYKFNISLCVTSLSIPLKKYDLLLETGVELKIQIKNSKKQNCTIEGCHLSLLALSNLDLFLSKNNEFYNSIEKKIIKLNEKIKKESMDKIGMFGEYEIYLFVNENYLFIGASGIVSLNLISCDLHPNKFIKTERENSFFGKIDFCVTKEGKNLLKKWMLFPLLDIKMIYKRRSVIEYLIKNNITLEIKNLLKKLNSFELNYTKKHLINLKNNICIFKNITNLLKNEFIIEINENFDWLNFIEENDTFIFKENLTNLEKTFDFLSISSELKKLKNVYKNLPVYLNEIGKKVFKDYKIEGSIIYFPQLGYLIETKVELNIEKIFEINQKKYFKNEFMINLDEEFGDIKNKINDLEIELTHKIIKKYSDSIEEIQNYLTEMDALNSLAIFAEQNNLKRGEINLKKNFKVQNLKNLFFDTKNNFDFVFDKSIILTGMNGSGKTNFLKNLAYLVILNQIGSFLPCESANLPLFDKILVKFSNTKPISSFVNDLQQLNEIIKFGNENSLILVDELGKGTSFNDGICVLLAVLKNLPYSYRIFSTNLHQLFLKNDSSKLKEEFSFLEKYKFLKTISIYEFGIEEGIFLQEESNKLIESFMFGDKFMDLFFKIKKGEKLTLPKEENEESKKIIEEFIK
ncbi:DNA mismatch repair [Tubulinosema ratisbonensis]|uniref:DNA mismatch repair n=1 Tax=Tubulinosema ratisbonensis TaxID=291195 RepID=A0A437AMY4_9MICR|nr:DNA mismatch repair [Tubulinosema ratisbonensis]